MSHPIEVSDEVFEAIAEYARQHGAQPDTIINAWLRDAMNRARESSSAVTPQTQETSQDPLARLAGIINIPDPDAGDHHDIYFGGDDIDA